MSPTSAYYASVLRQELCARNRIYAAQHKLPHVNSYGAAPVVVYQPDDDRVHHGNFLRESYRAILGRPEWRRRLNKVHAQAKQSLPRCDRGWKELDSSMSSDALLMNIFCYPGVTDLPRLRALLGIDDAQIPQFGVKARVPLKSGLGDRTEVDMRLGDLLVEAKLTESDFQTKSADLVVRYRDLEEVFDLKLLPRLPLRILQDSRPRGAKPFACYQLIRNVLAAYANQCSFCVILDARRPDLLESWYAVMRCVRPGDLRVRCKVLTWQELSSVLPGKVAEFLDLKYGIVPPGRTAIPVERHFQSDD